MKVALASVSAQDTPHSPQNHIEQAPQSANSLDDAVVWQKVSKATATWMWFDIYTTTLYQSKNSDPLKVNNLLQDGVPLKLELCYLKPIEKSDLIKGAQAVLYPNLDAQLRLAVEKLHQSYVDVKPEDCYTLQHLAPHTTELSLNGQRTFKTEQKGFKAVYFGIWLGDNPLSKSLKNSLIAPLIEKDVQ